MRPKDIRIGHDYLVDVDGKWHKTRPIRRMGDSWACRIDGQSRWLDADQFLQVFKQPATKRPIRVEEEKPDKPVKQKKPLRVERKAVVKKPLRTVKPEADHVIAARKRTAELDGILMRAGAGCGKTFSLVEGATRQLKGPTKGIIGSSEQDAIWEAMTNYRRPRSILFCAFNKSIATVLQRKVPAGCRASTLHAAGFALCCQQLGCTKDDIDRNKTAILLERELNEDIRKLRKDRPWFVSAVTKLVGFCKKTLSEPTPENLTDLATRYGIMIEDTEEVYPLVETLLQKSKEITKILDFDDQIWLPVILKLKPRWVYDEIVIDEMQDANKAQQQLALILGKRRIGCGDPRQSIYGFTGADTESMPRMESLLKQAGSFGQFPLLETRRCGHAIVAEANKIVPELRAHKDNPAGLVASDYTDEDMTEVLNPGDMVLCRINAPLASHVFRLLKRGKKAFIQGRAIGEDLIEFVTNLKATSTDDLIVKIDDFYYRELKRLDEAKHPSEDAKIILQDKVDCLKVFAEGTSSLGEVTQSIKTIFTDEGEGVLLSSIHRGKGLEADRVFLLRPEILPHPAAKTDEDKQQEENLKYVAITRAKNEFQYVNTK